MIISSHVKSHLTGTRPFISLDTMQAVAKYIDARLAQFDPRSIHQVAVVLGDTNKEIAIGNSYGNRVIIAVDIRTKVICSIFARYRGQGTPKACQVMIDLDGNIIE